MLSIQPVMEANHAAHAAAIRDTLALDADAEGDTLHGLADVVQAQAGAAGVLIAWHDTDDAEPTIIAATGSCTVDGIAARTLLAANEVALQAVRRDPVHQWIEIDGSRPSDALTIRAVVHRSIATLTTLHPRLDPAGLARARGVLGTLRQSVEMLLRLWHRHNADLAHQRALTLALDCSDAATLLVDRHCHVRFANSVGHELLRRKEGVCMRGAMLAATNLSDTMRLHAAIAHVCLQGGSAGARPPVPVLALKRAQGRPLLAAIMTGEADPVTPGETSAIVCLFVPERDLAPLVEPACNLYRLSPVEARLACLIANGRSLSEAAGTLHIREQTARSYLKQIFLKTDTKRQAELVWLLLKSSVCTAPGRRMSFL